MLYILQCVLEHSSFLLDEIALMEILFLLSALIHSTTYYANWFYQLTGTTSARVLRKFQSLIVSDAVASFLQEFCLRKKFLQDARNLARILHLVKVKKV